MSPQATQSQLNCVGHLHPAAEAKLKHQYNASFPAWVPPLKTAPKRSRRKKVLKNGNAAFPNRRQRASLWSPGGCGDVNGHGVTADPARRLWELRSCGGTVPPHPLPAPPPRCTDFSPNFPTSHVRMKWSVVFRNSLKAQPTVPCVRSSAKEE